MPRTPDQSNSKPLPQGHAKLITQTQIQHVFTGLNTLYLYEVYDETHEFLIQHDVEDITNDVKTEYYKCADMSRVVQKLFEIGGNHLRGSI